jgi:hypothetical protein
MICRDRGPVLISIPKIGQQKANTRCEGEVMVSSVPPPCRVDNVCDGWGSFETSWQCSEVGLGFSSSTHNIVALALFQTTKNYRMGYVPPKWKDTLGVSLASYLLVSLWLDGVVTTRARFLGAFTVRGSSRGNERTFYVEFVIWGTFLPSIDDFQHLAPFLLFFHR